MTKKESNRIIPIIFVVFALLILMISSLPIVLRKNRFEKMYDSAIRVENFILTSLDGVETISLSNEETNWIKTMIYDSYQSEIRGIAGVKYNIFYVEFENYQDIKMVFKLDEKEKRIYILFYYRQYLMKRTLYDDSATNYIPIILDMYPNLFVNIY